MARLQRTPIATPGYMTYWLQQVTAPETLPFKAIGAAAYGMLHSVVGIAALPLAWIVFALWAIDMAFGIGAAYKRKEPLTGQRAFDGVLKGVGIAGVVTVGHIMELAYQNPASGLGASIVLGAATVSLVLSIRPNALTLWSDAGEVLDRVGNAVGFNKGDTPPVERRRSAAGPTTADPSPAEKLPEET